MNVLIGVGGTGQHVAISYLHLARLADFDPARIVVIDNDSGGDVARALNKLKGELWHQAPPGGQIAPFPRDMEGTTPRAIFHGETTLRDLLLKHATDSLGSEHDADITEGFYGFPHLGATFSRALLQELEPGDAPTQNGNDLFRLVVQPLRTADADGRVGVAGSIVGGCGAGVIPQLLEILRTTQHANHKLKLQAVISLLTFELAGSPPQNDNGNTTAADRRMLDRDVLLSNAVSGMVHIRAELASLMDRVVFVATPDGHSETRENAGHRNQPLTPHYTHVMSAALQHMFFSASAASIANPNNESTLRVFSSGGQQLGPDLLPVPSRAFLESALNSGAVLPLDDFKQAFMAVTVAGQESQVLLPNWSLARALWVSALQIKLLEKALAEFDGNRWGLRYCVRKQARNGHHEKDVKNFIQNIIDNLRESLNWIRDAFLVFDDARSGYVARHSIEPGDAVWEMLSDDKWTSARGQSLTKGLRSQKFDVADFWHPVEMGPTPQALASELGKRAREFATAIWLRSQAIE